MILGISISGTVMLVGGITLFVLIAFEVIVGLRWIKLGRRRTVVHKWVAIGILGVAALHGLAGTLFVTGWRIL